MTKPTSKLPNRAGVTAWLAGLPTAQRASLRRLRADIRAAAPAAVVETIAWGVPMYYLATTPLFGLNAFAHHVSWGVGAATLAALGDALDGYDLAKGTIRITAGDVLPATLVKKVVKARLALHAAGKPG